MPACYTPKKLSTGHFEPIQSRHFLYPLHQNTYKLSKQNTLYKGIHFISFSNPKFLVDILIE